MNIVIDRGYWGKLLILFFVSSLFICPADSAAKTFELSKKKVLSKEEAVIREECGKVITGVDKFGQTRPMIMTSEHEKGYCKNYVFFDPNEGLPDQQAVASQGEKDGASTQADYFDIVARFSPVWYHDTDDSDYSAEHLINFDFDGDWNGLNNWENEPNYPHYATIYYSVVETATHYFIIYVDFHPRDWANTCTFGDCHENDLEGVQVVVRKNDGPYLGAIEYISTQSHGDLLFYSTNSFPREINDQSFTMRPKIYVEAKGHGVRVDESKTGHSMPYEYQGNFPGGDGMVYRYKGSSDFIPQNEGNDRDVSYALLPIEDAFWSRRSGVNDTFTSHFAYNGARGYSFEQPISGAFKGDTYGNDKANPPWAWNDSGYGNKGDWAIDPAYSFYLKANPAQPFALDYINNFYLAELNEKGELFSVGYGNSSTYFPYILSMGATGSNPQCEDNNYNKWCVDGGNHFPENMIGCYEIADDYGSQDCFFGSPEHTNYIDYKWNKEEFPYSREQIYEIVIRTMTNKNICSGYPGFEDDDGWEYGENNILTLVLDGNNNFRRYQCETGGDHGPFVLQVFFDANGLLDFIKVLAGDHEDEGAFEIVGVDVQLRGLCSDGTVFEECNENGKYCNNMLNLIDDCERCGCPAGKYCSVATGACLKPVGGPKYEFYEQAGGSGI